MRFEDETLVGEMVETVATERGALPLLAFAVSRLWEERDCERKLLTREAYTRIGGVAGALAQHAETALARLGPELDQVVRELFRNLVTPQGTRAVREKEDLLSVFERGPNGAGRRATGEAVLDGLVDARLLTEYEQPGDGGESHQQVEIVHESLLTAWPRLVRWRTQDADGAQLRDQLRQAAGLWDAKGRLEELLWTGRAFREYALWRERYPGGLSDTEGRFAREMTAMAGRRRRRRRLAVAAVVVSLGTGFAAVTALWGRSEAARQKADKAALRAEASKLLALGQMEIEEWPTGAVAYALKSLELSDTREARLFALRALQRGPVAILMPGSQDDGLETLAPAFSSNGNWLALGGYRKVQVHRRDGGEPIVLGDYPSGGAVEVGFGAADVLVTDHLGDIRGWDLATATEVWRARPETGPSGLHMTRDGYFTTTTVGAEEVVRRWSREGSESRLVGRMKALRNADIDAGGRWLAYPSGRKVYARSVEDWASLPRLLGQHTDDVTSVGFHPGGTLLAAYDKSGTIRI